MKNKKVLFLFVAVIVLCLSTALFAACNKNDTPPPSGSSFKEGDVIVDKDENTVTEKEYDEAGREVREISHVETLYNVTYLANDASVIYLKGNKSDEMYVSGYDGVPKTLSVKDLESKISLEGNPIVVKGITEEAFNGCETLTSVDLEKENTNALTFAIGDQAFANCPNLATVTLPTKVYMKSGSIGDGAFNNCESLTKVVIPNRFKTLGAYAFANCLKLETVTFNEGVAKVPQGFLYGCESLTSVTIPSTVNYVGNEAFSGCKKLTTITFPNSVTYVGEEALADCISLQSVKIPFIGNSYSPMSNSTFGNLFGTEDVVNPDTEESYLYEAHNHFIPKTLTTVEVTNATSLPAYAFAGLESLTSLNVTYTTADRIRVYAADTNYYNYDVPQITAVGAYAFAGLKNIENFPIPEKATAIGEAAFAATGLTDASLAAILMDAKTIGAGAFSSLEKVENVSIPQNVLSVDRYAFSRNANLKSFLAGAKTALSSGILAECRSLETVTVPYIGTASVYYEDIDSEPEIVVNDTPFATLFSTSVPSDLYDEDDFSLEENYYQAYGKYYVPNTLNTITVTSATAIPTNAFREILADSISIFLNSDMLSDLDVDGVTIEPSAFNDCANLTSFTIDSHITNINNYAFANSGLTSITIPESVTYVSSTAFENCGDLTSLTWNAAQSSVPDFSKSNITTLTLGEEVVDIPSNAFSNMPSLTTINVNATALNSIGRGAFSGTPWLTSQTGAVYLGRVLFTYNGTIDNAIFQVSSNTVAIESYALQNQSNVEAVYIPTAVTRIGEYAFNGCERLNVVLYSGTQDQYGNISKSYAGLSGKNVIYSASTRERTYTFSSDGETIDPQTAIYLSVLPIPAERVGYVFYGWYEDAEFSGDPISTPYFTTNRTGTTLYAKWIAEEEFNGLSDYSFYFYSQGSRIATVTDKFLQEFPTEPTRSGYTFAGWYDNSNFDGSPVSLPYHAQNNTTLYAKWVRNNVLDGTSFDTAYVAVVGQPYDVITTTKNPRVYFRFVPSTSGSYSITASNNSGDNYGHLYDSSKTELTKDDDGGNNGNFKITWSLVAGQTYYIVARMYSNGTGTFKITITMN